jgi:hypothetical protein
MAPGRGEGIAIDADLHLLVGVFGFGCSLVPLCARVPGPISRWGLHALMALAMGGMVVTGMTGPASLGLAGILLTAAAWAWYAVPRRRELLHMAVDLLAMALLLLLVPSHAAAGLVDGHAHGGSVAAGGVVAPVAILLFWVGLHVRCRLQAGGRPSVRDSLSSLGMIGSMVVMGLMAA